jgi:hypothetical protein
MARVREREGERREKVRTSPANCQATRSIMKTISRPHRRPLFLLPALAAVLCASSASAASVITTSNGIFTPSFRGGSNTTYFGWSSGTWDGNPPAVEGDPDITPDVVNGTPSINPASGALPTQAVAGDIVSGSNNIYTSVAGANALGLQLLIPTAGTPGLAGFTTIIAQGFGLSGNLFGFTEALDGFGFGAIHGIQPEYVIGRNADGRGQWWAKWELPGNAASYSVDVIGKEGFPGGSVLSVTDMQVDTWFSESGFAPDIAVVPEPSALLLAFVAAGFGLSRRRRA